ncbi:MAG: pitrilysin family protein [Acidobacteria bacterium]|nr:pitrilysin family protein [Acidobacteriota bacterium]
MSGPGPALTLLPSETSPLLTFRVQFRAGSIDDPAGKEGLNAVTALTIGQGGARDLTYREVIDRLYPMASAVGAQPDREVTTFIGVVHRDHLDQFYPLFIDTLLAPRFDADDFNRARDLLVASIETTLRSNDDEELGKEALNLILYEDHPYGRPDAGTVQGLKGITLDDIRSHYRRYFTRGNVRAGITGGYPDRLAEQMRSDLDGLPEGSPPRPDLPAPKGIDGMEILIVEKVAPATAISIGHPLAVTRSDPDYYALMIANSHLGEHRSFNGRLMNVMRGDRGLNYGDYSYIESFAQDGGSNFPLPNIPRRQQFFSIWIRPVDPRNAPFALRQATRELRKLVEEGLSNEEFEAARTFLLNYSKLWTQSLSRRLGYRMDSEFYGTGFLLDRIDKDLPRLTAGEVNAAVSRHLDPGNLKVAMVASDGKALRDILLSGKPTPITYQTPTTREDILKEDREIESYPLPIDASHVRLVNARELFER